MDLVNLSEQARIAWRLVRSRPVEIRMFGSAEARAQYDVFTRGHRRLPIISNKTFGVALFAVPADSGRPFERSEFSYLRRRRKRALDRGYTVAPFEARGFVERILEINQSSALRQGRPLARSYTDAAAVRAYCEKRKPFFGVFDKGGILRGYCHLPTLGEVALVARFLGEHDRLDDGIMYLLITDLIAQTAEQHARNGYPHWIMYDTYVGGSAGIRAFKDRCGFHPYRVKWLWSDRPTP